MTLRSIVMPVAIFSAGALLCGAATADVTVKPATKGYDIDITGSASATELIDAIASATGVDIKGKPEDTPVGANHLRNASLERALRVLLPKAPFVVKSDDEDMPTEIIFLSPSQNGDGTTDSQDASDPAMIEPDQSDDTAPMEPDPPEPMDDGSQDTEQ